ncbi:MAG: TatD family hydrolase [Kistimonas sp.]|nr:TatD family hydrolase [Kistimonas sp.]
MTQCVVESVTRQESGRCDPALFDSHCHLDFVEFDHDRQALLTQCARAGIKYLCLPATEQDHWPRLLALLGPHRQGLTLWGALGLHPCFMSAHRQDSLVALDAQLSRRTPYVVALGELGLDLSAGQAGLREQQALLAGQIELASAYGLPLILHARRSHDQLAWLLRKMKFKEGGIVHAWSGSDQQAMAFWRLGFRLGIGGSLTWDRAQRLQRQVASWPLEHMVLETDAPGMPPAHAAGQRNTPLTLLAVLDKMAHLRLQDTSELARQLTDNTFQTLRVHSSAPE